MSLITVDQLRQFYSKISGSDELLRAAIDGADGLQAGYCGYPLTSTGIRTMSVADYTLHLHGPTPYQRDVVCLGVRPVVAVTSVHADATRAYGASTELTEGTDFEVAEDEGLLLLTSSTDATWPVAFRGIKVVLSAGYADPPPALIAITASVVQSLLDRQNLQQIRTASMDASSISTEDLESLLPAAARAALDAGFVLRSS